MGKITNAMVTNWIDRYRAEGIRGLETRGGRGRKLIIDFWHILNGKRIWPIGYKTTDSLFYSTNRTLTAVGHGCFMNNSK